MPITSSWKGFSFPMMTPKEIRTLAAARPPSSTLHRGGVQKLPFRLILKPDKVDLDDVLPRLEPGPADQQDGELRDDGRDDDGEADGGVAVVAQERHQEPEPGKQHHVDVDDHCKEILLGYAEFNFILSLQRTWILIENALKVIIPYSIWNMGRIC